MTLKTSITISYEEHSSLIAIRDLLEKVSDDPSGAQKVLERHGKDNVKADIDLSSKVLSGMSHALYEEYLKLPRGDHLQLAYEYLVWTLDDRDLPQSPNTEQEPG